MNRPFFHKCITSTIKLKRNLWADDNGQYSWCIPHTWCYPFPRCGFHRFNREHRIGSLLKSQLYVHRSWVYGSMIDRQYPNGNLTLDRPNVHLSSTCSGLREFMPASIRLRHKTRVPCCFRESYVTVSKIHICMSVGKTATATPSAAHKRTSK